MENNIQELKKLFEKGIYILTSFLFILYLIGKISWVYFVVVFIGSVVYTAYLAFTKDEEIKENQKKGKQNVK